MKAMRQQISSAVDVIIQANRLQGGPRKITCITEVMNMEQDVIIMQEVFRYKQTGIDQNGRAFGQFEATACARPLSPAWRRLASSCPRTCSRSACCCEIDELSAISSQLSAKPAGSVSVPGGESSR